MKNKIRAISEIIQEFAWERPRVFIILCLIGLFIFNIFRFAIWPPIWPLAAKNPASTSFMEYRAGEWADENREVELKWTWKTLEQISPNLQKAVVVSEDSTFWTHSGFDWEGIKFAMNRNLAKGQLSAGGSTISQQLAKNLYFSPKKSLIRKAQEALVTWRIERALEKKRILEIYLNVVEWGDGIFGAEAAARHYFKTSAARLSPRQAATLVAMLPNPHLRQPGSRVVRNVSNIILRRMR
jgi:monofunctional biosynthetic peptidoglycan transglycosylase